MIGHSKVKNTSKWSSNARYMYVHNYAMLKSRGHSPMNVVFVKRWLYIEVGYNYVELF